MKALLYCWWKWVANGGFNGWKVAPFKGDIVHHVSFVVSTEINQTLLLVYSSYNIQNHC